MGFFLTYLQRQQKLTLDLGLNCRQNTCWLVKASVPGGVRAMKRCPGQNLVSDICLNYISSALVYSTLLMSSLQTQISHLSIGKQRWVGQWHPVGVGEGISQCQ